MDLEFIYCTEEVVRICDINFGNHLAHNRLIEILHNVRAKFLLVNELSELNCFDLSLILTKIEVFFKNQAFFNETLIIKLGIKTIKNVKLIFSYEVINKETEKKIALATTEMSFFDIKSQKIAKIPEKFIFFLTEKFG